VPGFATYADLCAEIADNPGKNLAYDFYKTGPTMQGAGTWSTLWKAAGAPAAGSNSGGTPGAAFTNAGINFDAKDTDRKVLLSFGGSASLAACLMLADRLVGVNFSLVSTGDKTINSAALTRYTLTAATGVQAWLEITTATTTSAAVIKMGTAAPTTGYTDAGGTGSRQGAYLTFPAAATVVQSMHRLPEGAGFRGIRSVENCNLTTAPAAGAADLVLLQQLACIPLVANTWNEQDYVLQNAGMPRVFDGAALMLACLGNATTAFNVWGSVKLAYG